MSYTIRHATIEDLPVILNLRDQAREIMRSYGNKDQWPEGYPLQEKFENDIEQGHSYVMMEAAREGIISYACHAIGDSD